MASHVLLLSQNESKSENCCFGVSSEFFLSVIDLKHKKLLKKSIKSVVPSDNLVIKYQPNHSFFQNFCNKLMDEGRFRPPRKGIQHADQEMEHSAPEVLPHTRENFPR